MKPQFTVLLFALFFSLSFSISAQSYEVIGNFKAKKSKIMSFSYDQKEGKINGYNYFRDKKCEVFMKEGGRVEDYEEKKQPEQEYKAIDRTNFKKNEDIFLFKNEEKENIFFFSDSIVYESQKACSVNIFEYPKTKGIIAKEKIRANIQAVSDSLFILIITHKDDEQNKMHNFVIDFSTKKIIDYFSVELKSRSDFFSTLFSFNYKNDYLLYEIYDYERLEDKELKERGISANKSIKLGKHTTSYFLRKLQTEQVIEYKIDQSDYFVGSIATDLLEDGSIEFTGLYSDTPQVRKGAVQITGSYMTNLCNDVKGIFKQTFKNGKKVKDEKIEIEKEVIKIIAPFEKIGFAGLAWKHSTDKTLFVMNVFSSYSPIFQSTHVVVGICLDKSNNIIWTESIKVEEREFNQFLMFNIDDEVDATDKEKKPYITTITGKQKITAYKIVCGKIYKKSYKIPAKIEDYEFYALENYVGTDNNLYALYNKKKEFKLVKLNTSQLIDAIIED